MLSRLAYFKNFFTGLFSLVKFKSVRSISLAIEHMCLVHGGDIYIAQPFKNDVSNGS